MKKKIEASGNNFLCHVAGYRSNTPNFYSEFMQSKIRQNIVLVCYNDSLTVEQISLETGIPLPYLDSEIDILVSNKFLVNEKAHYKTNIIILTEMCKDEIIRRMVPYHEIIASMLEDFLEKNILLFRQIGFVGADFSENTLRWQLITFLLRECVNIFEIHRKNETPLSRCDGMYLWLDESGNILRNNLLSCCTVRGDKGDIVYSFDYLAEFMNDRHNVLENDSMVNILCNIARGDCAEFNDYDLKLVTEMVRNGYLLEREGAYAVSMPLFTLKQYAAACNLVKRFKKEKVVKIINEMNKASGKIISDHTPIHLIDMVPFVVDSISIANVCYIPLYMLIEKGILDINRNPLETATMQIQLNK